MKKSRVVPVAAFVLSIAIAVAAYNVLKDLDPTSSFFGGPSLRLTQVGEIESVIGEVEKRLPQSVQFERVSDASPLHDQTNLVTREGSEAVLTFATGGMLRVHENSRVAVEADSSQTSGKGVNVTVLEGAVTLVTPGPKGTLRIFENGKEMAQVAGASSKNVRIPVLTIRPKASTARADAAEPEVEAGQPLVASTPDPNMQPLAAPKVALTKSEREKARETLSNEQIATQLRSQTSYFQRCYLIYLNRVGGAKTPPKNATSTTARTHEDSPVPESSNEGNVVVNFKIQPTGKVNSAKIIKTEIQDTQLLKCIAEVVERTQFRSFAGDEIPVQEFPILLQ